jgi:hypothetical protein
MEEKKKKQEKKEEKSEKRKVNVTVKNLKLKLI